MKLKFNIYFLILTSLVLGLLPLGQARAESYLKKASFVSLPVGSTAPTGVVNSSTASFRVEVELQDNFQPEKMSLFLDQKILPIDERIYDTGNNYIFSSNTRDNQELQSLLTEAGKSANGYHSLSLLADVSGDQVVIWNYSFFADFDSPCGNFSIQTPAEKNMLKVGDQVEIIYTAQ